MQRRSANEVIQPNTQVVLGDSMGEMFAYYAACDIAFIGGSLLPFGAQNLIEACAVGKPVLIGPHTYNFAQATELAVASGAAIQVHDADELVLQLHRLLQDAPRAQTMAEAGLRFVSSNQGATELALSLIDSMFAKSKIDPKLT
jgi:3-deoxy-D-manno-octulosonic-acid transferase